MMNNPCVQIVVCAGAAVIALSACQKKPSEFAQFLPAELLEHDFCPSTPPTPIDPETIAENYCAMVTYSRLDETLPSMGWKNIVSAKTKETDFGKIMANFMADGAFPATQRMYKYGEKIKGCDLSLHLNQPPTPTWSKSKKHDTFVTLRLENCAS